MFRKLFRNLISDKQKTTITDINLELVNYCNLNCKWCALDPRQPKQVMQEDLLHRLFMNLITDDRFRSVARLNLWNGGETLLHPRFVAMLETISKYKRYYVKNNIFFPQLRLLTNGTILNKKLAEELIRLNVLDVVRFSIDGGSREKYEEIRYGANWAQVASNIKEFMKIKNGRIEVGIICLIEIGRPRNMDWMTKEFREILELVEFVELRYPHNWIGDIEVSDLPQRAVLKKCNFMNHNLVIFPSGDVSVCCADLNGVGIVGNLYEKDLYQIYASKKRRQMLLFFRTGRRKQIRLCRSCSGYN